jgi:hypothetical protein
MRTTPSRRLLYGIAHRESALRDTIWPYSELCPRRAIDGFGIDHVFVNGV